MLFGYPVLEGATPRIRCTMLPSGAYSRNKLRCVFVEGVKILVRFARSRQEPSRSQSLRLHRVSKTTELKQHGGVTWWSHFV